MRNGSDHLRSFLIVSGFGLTSTTNDHELVDSRECCLSTLRSNPETRTNWVVRTSKFRDAPWAFLHLSGQIRHSYTGKIGELEELGGEHAQPLGRVRVSRALKALQTARTNDSPEPPRRWRCLIRVYWAVLRHGSQLDHFHSVQYGHRVPRNSLRTSLPGNRPLRPQATHVVRYFREGRKKLGDTHNMDTIRVLSEVSPTSQKPGAREQSRTTNTK